MKPKAQMKMNLARDDQGNKKGVCTHINDKRKTREYLSKLDMHKSVVLGGMHPCMLRELADVVARLLSIVFD